MSVRARDNEICVAPPDPLDLICFVDRVHDLRQSDDVVTAEPGGHIIDMRLRRATLCVALDELKDIDLLGPLKERERVIDRAARLTRVLPCHRDTLQAEILDLGWNNENGAPRLHDQIARVEPLERVEQRAFATGAGDDQIGSAPLA